MIVVRTDSPVLGQGIFWQGPDGDIEGIRNIVARDLAEDVAMDHVTRRQGMWVVSWVEDAPAPRPVVEITADSGIVRLVLRADRVLELPADALLSRWDGMELLVREMRAERDEANRMLALYTAEQAKR